jgi:hypothetical protein
VWKRCRCCYRWLVDWTFTPSWCKCICDTFSFTWLAVVAHANRVVQFTSNRSLSLQLAAHTDIVSYILLFVAVWNSKILQVNLASGTEFTCEIFDTEIVMLDLEMSHLCGAEIAVSDAIRKWCGISFVIKTKPDDNVNMSKVAPYAHDWRRFCVAFLASQRSAYFRAMNHGVFRLRVNYMHWPR